MANETCAASDSGRSQPHRDVASRILLILAISLVALVAAAAIAMLSSTDVQADPDSDYPVGEDYGDYYVAFTLQDDKIHYCLELMADEKNVRLPDCSPTDRPKWEKDARFSLVDEVYFNEGTGASGKGFAYIGAYTFYGCTSLKTVTFEDWHWWDQLDEVGDYAFANCTSLENIRITDTWEGHINHTFSNDVEKIGKYAFLNCKSLKYVGFHSSGAHTSEIKTIEEGAFYGSGLTGFYIHSTITYIGPGAFGNCPDFPGPSNDSEHFSVRDGVLFQGSTLLQFPGTRGGAYTVGDGVTVADYAFAGCYKLTQLTFDNVAGASEHSFEGLHLKISYQGHDVYAASDLGGRTFLLDTDSDHIYYAASGSTGDCHFIYTADFTAMMIFGTGAMGDYTQESLPGWFGHRDVLSTVVLGPSVTSIGKYAFYGCDHLVSMTAEGASVTTIGGHSFHGCSRLVSVTLVGGSLTSVGEYAFYGCYSLESSCFSDGELSKVTSIGEYAFYGCAGEGFTAFELPYGVTTVARGAFSYCSHLVSFTFAGTAVTSIAGYAFYSCPALMSDGFTAKALANLTSVGAHAFERCRSLTSVTAPSGITALPDSVFKDCTSLTTLVLPNGLTTIGAHAFEGCTGLTTVSIGEGVTLGASAFKGCGALVSASFGTGLRSDATLVADVFSIEFVADGSSPGSVAMTELSDLSGRSFLRASDSRLHLCDGPCDGCGYHFDEASGTLYIFGTGDMRDYTSSEPAPWHGYADRILRAYVYDGVTSVGDHAFDGCVNLASATLPGTLKSIGDHAFGDCVSLRSVNIPAGVSHVGEAAFNVAAASASGIGDVTYDGSEHTPDVEVTWSGYTLTRDVNFTVSYSDNVHAGTARVTVTGTGHFCGELASTFTILKQKVDIPAVATGLVYDGTEQIGVVPSDLYTVAGGVAVDAGIHTATAALVDTRDYEWSNPAFTGIIEWALGARAVTLTSGSYAGVYDGRAHSVEVHVTSGSFAGGDAVSFVVAERTIVCTSIRATFEVVWGDVKASNYDVTKDESGTITISKRPLDILVADAKIRDGKVLIHDVTATDVYGLVDGAAVTAGCVETTSADPGLYEEQGAEWVFTADIETSDGIGNYDVTCRVYLLIAQKATVTVTPVQGQSKVFGESDPVIVYTWACTDPDFKPVFEGTLARAPGEDVGRYTVSQGTLELANGLGLYELVFTEGVGFMITPKALDEGDFKVDTSAETYTGSEITKNITSKLVLMTDYTVSYTDNVNAGTAKIVITGTGNYAGTLTYGFRINPRGLAADDFRVDTDPVTYTGSAITKSVTPLTGLVLDRDYAVTYTDNVNAGTAKVVITGTGNYAGTLTYGFTILKQRVDAPPAAEGLIYDGTEQTGVSPSDLYTVTGGTAVDAGAYTAIVDLTDPGNHEWSTAFSGEVRWTVAPRPVTVASGYCGADYDAMPHTVSVSVTSGSFSDRDHVTYDVIQLTDVCYRVPAVFDIVWGDVKSSNYDVTKVYGYITIEQRNLVPSDFLVDIRPETYTGSPITKQITTFLQEKDYTVTYSGNVDAGIAEITIKGVGNCKGTLEYQFEIRPKGITTADFSVDTNPETYTGSEITKAVVPLTGLVPGRDYTVSYDYNVNVGKALVTVTGTGNHSGTLTYGFEITPKALILPDARADGRVYDGTADVTAQVTLGELSGVCGADDVRVRQGWTASISSMNVGTYDIVIASLFLDGRSAPNYTLDAPSLSVTISARDLSVTVVDGKITDGEVLAHVIADDDVSGLVAGARVESGAVKTTSSDPGKYTAKGTGWVISTPLATSDGIGNYRVEFTVTLYIFDKLTVLVIPDSGQSKVYGESDPELTYHYVKIGEYEPGFAGSLSRTKGDDIDSYAITRGDLKLVDKGEFIAKNYELAFYDGEVFTILPKALTDDDFHVNTDPETYTGRAIEKDISSPTGLEQDRDYTVTYSGNVNAGTAVITIEGMGNHSGTLTYTFTILPRGVTKDDFDVDITPEVYTGSPITKTVKPLTGLVLNKDYVVSYADNVNAGRAVATVTGTGNYTGSLTYLFKITPKALVPGDFHVNTDSETYTGSEIKKDVEPLTGLVERRDYNVSYSDNVNAGTAFITVSGTGNYSGSLVYTFEITPRTIVGDDFDVDHSASTYTGSEITKKISSGLVQGTDYTVSYENNVNVGTARMTIEGKGNYQGALTYRFEISPKAVINVDFQVNTGSETYTGSEIRKDVEPLTGLVEGKDYAVTYRDNVNAGTAYVVIEGMGNYTGTLTYSFRINPKAITTDDFKVDTSEETYTGSAITKTIISPTGLILDRDYTVSYSDNVRAGTAYIFIEGSGNHCGTMMYSFIILKRTVGVPDELYYVHTGSQITFEIPTSQYWKETTGHARSGTDAGTYSYFLEIDPNCTWSDPSFTGTYHVYITLEYVSHVNEKGVTDVIVTSPTGVRADYRLVVSYPGVSDVGGYGFGGCTAKYVYDVKVLDADGREVTGPYSLTLLIPGDLLGSVCDVYHVHDGTVERMTSTFGGSYVTVTSPGFSDFVLVGRAASGSQPVLAAVLVAAALVAVTAGLAWATSRRML